MNQILLLSKRDYSQIVKYLFNLKDDLTQPLVLLPLPFPLHSALRQILGFVEVVEVEVADFVAQVDYH